MAAIGTLPVLFATGVHGSRPSASAVGKGGLYSCTTHSLVYQTDGSSWSTWATLGGTSSILQTSKATRTAGDLTTTSTTFVDVTSLSVTITTGAHLCLVIFSGVAKNNTNDANTAFTLDIDGSNQGGTYGITLMDRGTSSNSLGTPVGFTFLTSALSAASHTFKIQWRVDAGTGTLFASSSVTPAILTVLELGL